MNKKIEDNHISVQYFNENSIKLDKNQYTISIIKKALEQGNINVKEAADIQRAIMELLKKQIIRYTRGESSSVTEETAEGLLNSILYTLDFYLLNCSSVTEALNELHHQSMDKLYEKGVQSIKLCVMETKKLYWEIVRERLSVDIEAYNDTLDEGIPIFFEKYNIIFEAHNTMASIDYPLAFDDMRVRGISCIKNYLEHLELENELCRNFDDEEINKLLESYGKMCRLNHRIELINIFEVVINNALFSNICGNKTKILSVSDEQYHKLVKELELKERNLVRELINSSLEKLIINLDVKNTRLIEYMRRYVSIFLDRILNALEHNCLDKVIAVDYPQNKHYKTAFDEGKRMSGKEFEKLLEEILDCSKGEDKTEIINSNVHSLQDYIDILNGDCLFEDDFDCLFSRLGVIELAVLVKLMFFEDIRDGETNMASYLGKKSEADIEWQKCFCEFLKRLDTEKTAQIEELIEEIDYDELIF